MGKTEDRDYLVLYKDFDRLYELVNKDQKCQEEMDEI